MTGRLFIVGKNCEDDPRAKVGAARWEFIGVFSDEAKAVAACLSYRYFVGPATLDVALSDGSIEWTGAFYPIIETEP